jgi:hypothetical protein
MIDREHELPLARQTDLLGLSRSSLYYEARPVPASELAIMRRIDALHMDYPNPWRTFSRQLSGISRAAPCIAPCERAQSA